MTPRSGLGMLFPVMALATIVLACSQDEPETVVSGFTLSINGIIVKPDQQHVDLPYAFVSISPGPGEDGRYAPGVVVTLVATPSATGTSVEWREVDAASGALATVAMDADRLVTVVLADPFPR